MQSDISNHPRTPLWNPANMTAQGANAILLAVMLGRDFSFLLSAEELAARDRQASAQWRAAEALARSYGYGGGGGLRGRYQGD